MQWIQCLTNIAYTTMLDLISQTLRIIRHQEEWSKTQDESFLFLSKQRRNYNFWCKYYWLISYYLNEDALCLFLNVPQVVYLQGSIACNVWINFCMFAHLKKEVYYCDQGD